MTTLSEIRDIVIENLQDASIEDVTIDRYINDGYKFIAKRILLPNLESGGTFSTQTDAKEVSIPTGWGYGRNLYHAAIADASPITVLNSIALLRQQYPEFDTELTTGEIEYVVIRSGSIVYYPVPDTVTVVNCNFFALPLLLASDLDEPVALPVADQEDLLVNFSLWKIWAKIEDGIEGQKVNTLYHKGEFFEVYNTLDDDIVVGQSQPDPVRESSWI